MITRPGHDVKLSATLRTYFELTMEFQLPSNLKTELIPYDATLKQLAKLTKQPGTKAAKPKYPLGNVNDLIPEDIVDPAVLQQVVDRINNVYAQDRCHTFRPTDEGVKSTAILYHYEQLWIAAWLPPEGEENVYVYGYAYAFKDTESARKLNRDLIANNQIDTFNKVSYGRSQFFVRKRYVTVDDIKNGDDIRNWNHKYMSYGKGINIRPTVIYFENALRQTIPQWQDSRYIFERLKDSSILNVLFEGRGQVDSYFKDKRNSWLPSASAVIDLLDNNIINLSPAPANTIRHIVDKPFFRKWIQQQCDEVLAIYNNKDNKSRKAIQRPWNIITLLFNRLAYVNRIWPDCPIDYYQNNIDTLLTIDFGYFSNRAVDYWLNTYMPVASFFNILNKFKEQNTSNGYTNNETGLTIATLYNWRDTYQMLGQILSADKTIEPPRRWRLNEFHDHVQAEAWKIQHPNSSLPQDLFPAPVRITYNEQTWSFFQPIDTHQLSSWGQAVRNCVGNASSYAEGVRKKKHFIVLCIIDGKPTFTVQLTVDNGMMSVTQIVGTSNARLSSDQQAEYTEAFRLALQARESELGSKG